jgi:hypothetical protein
MPTSLLPEEMDLRLSDENLLAVARSMWRWRNGRLPLNIVADLMERGFIVEELEQQWEASLQESI